MVPIIVASRRAGSSDKDAALDADADDYVTKYMAQLRHKLEDDPSPPRSPAHRTRYGLPTTPERQRKRSPRRDGDFDYVG